MRGTMDPRAFLLLVGVVLLLAGVVTWGQIPDSLPLVMTVLGGLLTFFGVISIVFM